MEAVLTLRIIGYSLLMSFAVLIVALTLQWVIYDDWLHDPGPLRLVGTLLASAIAFGFTRHWHMQMREKELEAERRFQLIAEMNDKIRNALQKIECLSYGGASESTDGIHEAVEIIDIALRGMADGSTSVTASFNSTTNLKVSSDEIALR
jgi:hypothetical protein